jgi:tetratricopeptide (TPR) repeat protein
MNRRVLWVSVLALVGLTVITYAPTLRNGFIWDDDDHLTANPAMTLPGGLHQVWTSLTFSRYYPLTLTTFWVQRRLWGLNPLPYHAVNIVLHATSTVLLFFLLRRLNVRAAWVAAALWAVHPVNVESVAWITELKNVQSGLFFFASLLCYLRFENCRARTWFAASLGCFAAALLSKPSTVVLPLVLLLLAWWQRGRCQRTDFIRALPFLGLAAAMSVLTVAEQHLHIALAPKEWSLTLTERFLLAGKALWFYAAKVAWPGNLIFVYPRWELNADSLATLLPLLAAIAVAVILWRLRRRPWARASLFGLGYFAVALLPVLGFFDIFYFRYSFVADHFQYLACLGVVALVASGAATVLRRRRLQVGASSLAIVGLVALNWQHGCVFHDDEALWRDTVARNPHAAMAYNNLGMIFNGKKQYEQAAELFHRALLIKPDFLEAHSNLGVSFTELGSYQEAEQELQKALRIKPDHGKAHYALGRLYSRMKRTDDAIGQHRLAISYAPTMPEPYFELAALWHEQGKRAQAIQYYRMAVALRPDYVLAQNNLANALVDDGQPEEAVQHYQLALKTAPDAAGTHYNLGLALAKLNRTEEAIQHLQQSTRLMPDFADGYVQWTKVLTQQGRFAEAIAMLRSALSTNSPDPIIANKYAWLLATCPVAELRNAPQAIQIGEELAKATGRKSPQPLDTLAAAYAEAGRFPEAQRVAREALALATSGNDTNLATQLAARVALYEKNRPFHSGPP